MQNFISTNLHYSICDTFDGIANTRNTELQISESIASSVAILQYAIQTNNTPGQPATSIMGPHVVYFTKKTRASVDCRLLNSHSTFLKGTGFNQMISHYYPTTMCACVCLMCCSVRKNTNTSTHQRIDSETAKTLSQ